MTISQTQKKINQTLQSILPVSTYQPNKKQVTIFYRGKTMLLSITGRGGLSSVGIR
jgi:hypothetical protein